MLGLEALTGSLDDFGFEDYLNGKMMIYEMSLIHITHLILFSIFICIIWESFPVSLNISFELNEFL